MGNNIPWILFDDKLLSSCAGMIYARPSPGINEICKVVGGAYKVSKDEMNVKEMKAGIWPYIYRESILEVHVMK